MNLDGMFPDELMEFWAKTNRQRPIKLARELFPEKPKGYVKAVRELGFYASNKATAMNCRERGDINTALMYEGICERIYTSLPEFARW